MLAHCSEYILRHASQQIMSIRLIFNRIEANERVEAGRE